MSRQKVKTKKIFLFVASLICINSFAVESTNFENNEARVQITAEDLSNILQSSGNSEVIDQINLDDFQTITLTGESAIAYNELIANGDPQRVTAGLLAIFLGDFGVQHFYVGKTLRGVLSIVFCWTGVPAVIGLVQGIIWLTTDDADFQARISK